MKGLVNAYEGRENKVVVLMRDKSGYNPDTGCDVPVIELSILPRTGTPDVEIAGDILDLIIAFKVYGRRFGKQYILIEDDDQLGLTLRLLGFRRTNINNQMGMAL